MKDNKKEKFDMLVGVFSIIGVITAIIFGLLQLLFSDSETVYNVDFNQQNGDGIFNQYKIDGDFFLSDNYYSNEKESFINTQSVLYQRLKDNTSENILCFVPGDFDNDGNYEAFAFLGECLENEGFGEQWVGNPYFVNDKTVKKIPVNTRFDGKDLYWATYKLIELGKNKAIVFTLYGTSASADMIFGVKNKELIKYEIPGCVGELNVTNNFITLTISAYDFICYYDNYHSKNTWCGHTWKPYYFFWNDGTDNFSEYGGVEITLEQLSEIKDVSTIVKEYENYGYDILNILYRANGIININFEKKEHLERLYKNITLFIKNDNDTTLMDDEILERNEGIYVKAINPEIAVYPEFPNFKK